jgi:hypothetical protein
MVFDGNYEVYFLPSAISDASAPSLAAMQAGTNLTAFIPKDGFNPAVTNNRVQGGDLASLFVDESMGTYTSAMTIACFKDDTADTAYDTIGVQGATGAIVVVPNGPAAQGVKAYVWPDVEFGQPIPMQTAANAQQKFTADVAVRKQPNFHATVAA